MSQPLVGIIMGSDSDLDIMGVAAKTLEEMGIQFEVDIVSAHRTPEKMAEYAQKAQERGIKVIIAGAGGSAHLPGMSAAYSYLPVIAVPIKRDHHGDEALKSSYAMPPGVALGVMPPNGAKNAALYAAAILAVSEPEVKEKLVKFRSLQHDEVLEKSKHIQEVGWENYLKEMDK